MATNTSLILLFIVVTCSFATEAYVEAVAGVFDVTQRSTLPQVTVRCGFLNKHVDLATGQWADGDTSFPCDASKNAILDYCRRVYSDLDVNNIEDSNEEVEISHWCPMDAPDIPEGCSETFTVTTYTCLVGPFESKALMVPKGCNFEHIHDSESCKPKSELHSMAEKQCAASGNTVRDFGMLLPCEDEVDLFTGVEFVCCPVQAAKPKKTNHPDAAEDEPVTAKPQVSELQLKVIAPAEPTEPETEQKAIPNDAYFNHLPETDDERTAFEQARERLEEKEDRERTKVMQQWQEAQDQYEALKKTSPKKAEALRKGMMERFDDRMAELEISSRREHDKLRAVHQQRVQTTLTNQRTLAEQLFADSLRDDPPKTKKVLHTLQKYVKSIQRDRQHGINVYKHLLTIDPARAEADRPQTLQRLRDMDTSIQHCLEMLKKASEFYEQIKTQVDDLVASNKSPEETAFQDSLETALTMSYESEEEEDGDDDEDEDEAPTTQPSKKAPAKSKPLAKISKSKKPTKVLTPSGKAPSGRKLPPVPDLPQIVAEAVLTINQQVVAKVPDVPKVAVKGKALPAVKIVSAEAPEGEDGVTHERDALVDEVAPQKHIPVVVVKPLDQYRDEEPAEADTTEQEPPRPSTPSEKTKPVLVAKKQPKKPKKAAASRMDKGVEFRPKANNAISSSVSQKSIKYGATPALAFGLACGVLAVATVMVVAVVLVRRKTRRVPINHGFTEIDPNMTVEQRHIAAMQANGYENPTYKYFEMQ